MAMLGSSTIITPQLEQELISQFVVYCHLIFCIKFVTGTIQNRNKRHKSGVSLEGGYRRFTATYSVMNRHLFWAWHRAIVDLKTEKFQLISVLDYAISCFLHNIHVEVLIFHQNTFFYKFRMINPSSLFSFLRK